MTPSGPPLPAEQVMAEVGERVRARLRAEIAEAHPDSPLLAPGVFEEAEAILRRAAEPRRILLLPELLPGAEEVTLDTTLRLTSHRPWLGGPILWVKRKLLLPLLRWLYEFSRDNFERQARVNALLMASVETLVVELVELRQEVERLRTQTSTSEPADRS